MQRGHQTHFLERLLYYASKLINRQGKKGKSWNYQLNKVYVISLADFPIAEYQGCPDFVQDLILQNPKYPNLPFDFLTIRTLETEKFTKTKEELETKYDQWMFYLTQMAGWEEEPNKLPEDRAIQRLLEVVSILNLEKAEYEQYQAEIDRRNDEYSRLVSAGEKGEARGEAKGRDERTIEIAKAMLADGVDMKIVSKYSSLSLEELAKL